MRAQERLNTYMVNVEDYLKLKGIPCPRILEYLEITPEEFGQLDGKSALDIAYDIARYSYNLTQTANEFNSRISRCDSEIKRLVGTQLDNYGVFGIKEKWIAAIADNELATEYDVVRGHLETLVVYLKDQVWNLDRLYKAFMEKSKS